MDEIVYCAAVYDRGDDELSARRRLSKAQPNYRRPESEATNPAFDTCEPILMVGRRQMRSLSSAREAWPRTTAWRAKDISTLIQNPMVSATLSTPFTRKFTN